MSRYSREEIQKLINNGVAHDVIQQLLADQDRLCEYLDFDVQYANKAWKDKAEKLLKEIRG